VHVFNRKAVIEDSKNKVLGSPGREVSKEDFFNLKKRLTSNLATSAQSYTELEKSVSRTSLASRAYQIAEN